MQRRLVDPWKKKCEESCQQPCIHIEYETSLSYETLQKNVLIKKLNSLLGQLNRLYKHFLNKSECLFLGFSTGAVIDCAGE